jgi:hypothetical protein
MVDIKNWGIMKLWVGKKGAFTKLNCVGWKNNLCATRLKPNNKKLHRKLIMNVWMCIDEC